MDWLTPYAPINGLGHAVGQMVAFAGVIFNGIFEKYPNVRIGFMEAGVSWLQTCLERFDRGWETHIQYDPRGEYIQLKPGEKVSDYIRRHVEAGQNFCRLRRDGAEAAPCYSSRRQQTIHVLQRLSA